MHLWFEIQSINIKLVNEIFELISQNRESIKKVTD